MKSSDIDTNTRRSSRRKSSFSGISIAPKGLYSSPRASIDIERQLNSLLEENKEDDPIHLLQDNFSNVNITSVNSESVSKVGQRHCSCSNQDFSVLSSPFTEHPKVCGHHSFYIPAPTSIRHYIDSPDDSILSTMDLPYPFRIRESHSGRLDRVCNSCISNLGERRSRHQSRDRSVYSISMDETIMNSKAKIPPTSHQNSSISDQVNKNIMAWLPEQNTEWSEWQESNSVVKVHRKSANHPVHPLD